MASETKTLAEMMQDEDDLLRSKVEAMAFRDRTKGMDVMSILKMEQERADSRALSAPEKAGEVET